mgnify:CR=1 FL=1
MLILDAHPALGTRWWVEVFDGGVDPTVLAPHLTDRIEAFEARYSRFREDSLVSQLNRTGELIEPPAELLELLTDALYFAEVTDGVFNVLVGAELVRRGYDAHYSLTESEAAPAPPPDPTHALTLSPQRITLTSGSLDLGGFGKGYLIDLLVRELRESWGLAHFLINGGGDVYASSQGGAPLTIHLEDPTTPGHALGAIALFEQGFAASAGNRRRWHGRAGPVTHLVDARDPSAPPPPTATFVVADCAAEADMWATTLTLSGTSGAPPGLAWAQYDPETRRLRASSPFHLLQP